MQLQITHIGCLVDDLESSKEFYRNALGFSNISENYMVISQNVKLCFVEIGPNFFLELIQPLDANSALAKLRQKNTSYYHLAYYTPNIEKTVNDLRSHGSVILSAFLSEAFCGRKCVFLYTRDKHLIELIEDDPGRIK